MSANSDYQIRLRTAKGRRSFLGIRSIWLVIALLLCAVWMSACNPTGQTTIGTNFYPGVTLSDSNSSVTVSNSEVVSGNIVSVTVYLRDTNGNAFVSTLPTVSLQESGGTSTGTFSAVTNNGDGSYSASFTGGNKGSPTTIRAIVDGQVLTSALPTLTVVSGTGVAASITVVSASNNQSAFAGATLGAPLQAIVQDAGSNPLSGVTVIWAVASGGGSVLGCSSSTTDGTGTASCTPTLGTVAGTNTVTASVSGVATPATFTATGTASSTTTSIVWGTAPSLTYTASSSTPMTTFTAKLEDAYGNVITSNSSTTVTASITSGSGTLGGTTTVTVASGIATFSAVTDTAASTITIQAQENTANHTVTQSSVVVSPGAVGQLIFTTEPSDPSPKAGVAFATQPVVTVKDTYGNLITSANSVLLKPFTNSTCTTGGSGTLGATTNPLATSAGLASFAGVNYTASGALYIQASVSGITACSSLITLGSATPAKLAWTTAPTAKPLVNQCKPVQIGVQDTYGNTATVTGSTDTVTFTSNGSGAFYSDSGCTTPQATSTIGVGSTHTSTMYFTDTVPEVATLGATSAPLSVAPNQSVTSQLKAYLNYSAMTFTAGTCVPITITTEDYKGNITAVPVSSTIGGLLSAGNSTTYSNNTCTTLDPSPTLPSGQSMLTLYTTDLRVESFAPYIQSSATYVANGPTIATVTVTAAAPSTLVVTGPTYVTPGTCGGPYTAYSADAYGNLSPITGSALSVGLSATGSAQLFSSSGCTSSAASISIGIGSTSQVFYAKDTATEFSTLTAAAAGFTSSTFVLDSNAVSNLQGIAVGEASTCVIISGGVKCWGNNGNGALGNGTTTLSFTPVDVSGLGSGSGVQSIVALNAYAQTEDSVCALKSNGSVWCWGYNTNGELGNGNGTRQLTPVEIFSGGISQISGSEMAACAVTSAGALYCWGYGNYGQLGLGNTTSYNTPQEVLSSGVLSVSVGFSMACIITTGGDLKCFGGNNYGDLGNGNTTQQDSPTQVSGLTSGITDVANSEELASCAINSSGAVLCWGNNSSGELGIGNTSGSSLTPVASLLTSGAQSLTAGNSFFCALMTTGALNCWGHNSNGNLGDGGNSSTGTPQEIFSSGVQAVNIDLNTTCAIVEGNLQCWGSGNDGQLGTGLSSDSHVPVFPGSLE